MSDTQQAAARLGAKVKFEPSNLIPAPARFCGALLVTVKADVTRLTCPFAQPRREQLPVAQDPDPEAREQPVEQPQRQGGHGERTDPEERRLGPAERLLSVHPLHGSGSR